jgi:hypothetical protein
VEKRRLRCGIWSSGEEGDGVEARAAEDKWVLGVGTPQQGRMETRMTIQRRRSEVCAVCAGVCILSKWF